MSSSSWTAERITTQTGLWRLGQSAAQIAHALGGVSRNAVIGKIHRLGLARRVAPSKPGAPSVSARRVRTTPRKTPSPPPRTPPTAPAAIAPRRAKVVVEAVARIFDTAALTARVCRWPIGDPRTERFGYCGAWAPVLSPYCADHRAIAYAGPSSAREGSKMSRTGWGGGSAWGAGACPRMRPDLGSNDLATVRPVPQGALRSKPL